MFVKHDVILGGMGVYLMARTRFAEDQLAFKFLRYGTSFFGGEFAPELDRLITDAVLDGSEGLLAKPGVKDVIKCIMLPFYQHNERMNKLEENLGSP